MGLPPVLKPPFPLDRMAGPDSLRALGLPPGSQAGPNFLSSSAAGFWPENPGLLRLPSGWEDILRRALKKRLAGSRNLRLYLENCQRCGACADKCPVYAGSGDALQMPVLRAELLRAVYRKNFTLAGRLLGKLAGGRQLNAACLTGWFHYFHYCVQCRRCALYCPQGIDCSEISALGRELLLELGLGREGIIEPLRRSWRCGNPAGAGPERQVALLAQLRDQVEDLTGLKISTPLNESGHQVLFVPAAVAYGSGPAADLARLDFTGSLMLLHAAGLDYTLSPLAGGMENYGLFARPELRQALARRLYAEAARLGCKWILAAGEGSGWRVLQQYAGPLSRRGTGSESLAETYGLETPRSPASGTLFTQAAGGVLHLDIFAADLVARRKIRLRSGHNRNFVATFHDSCQAARSLGLMAEPRQVLLAACAAFQEMPDDTVRERTFCCGGGGGLAPNPAAAQPGGAGRSENNLREIRLRAGMPRGQALRRVQRENGVNLLVSSCASCLGSLPDLTAAWAPGVEVAGLYELLGNAIYLRGEKKRRFDLRGRLLPGQPASRTGRQETGQEVGQEAGQASGQAAGKAAGKTEGKASGKVSGKTVGKAAGQTVGKAVGAAPDSALDSAPDPIPDPAAAEGFLDPKVLEDLARLAQLADLHELPDLHDLHDLPDLDDLDETAEKRQKTEPPA